MNKILTRAIELYTDTANTQTAEECVKQAIKELGEPEKHPNDATIYKKDEFLNNYIGLMSSKIEQKYKNK